MTTDDLSSAQLLEEERSCRLPAISQGALIELGEYAVKIAKSRALPVAIAIRIDGWLIFKAALPGSKPSNDGWIERKARVVELTHHATLFEKVKAEEEVLDWHAAHGVTDETHAIHGGGIPLFDSAGEYRAALIISGLPQVEDHQLGIEIVKGYLAR